MRYLLPAFVLAVSFFLSGCSSEEKEPLNILGMTLDMSVAELYEKIEPHNQLIGGSANIIPEEFAGMYRFALSKTERLNEEIVAFSIEPNLNEKPLSIKREIWTFYDSAEDFDKDDIFSYAQEQFIEKFGEPAYKQASLSESEDMIWMMDNKKRIKKCGNFEDQEYVNQSIINDGCEYILTLDFYESDDKRTRVINLLLNNLMALAAHEEKIDERYNNQSKPRF